MKTFPYISVLFVLFFISCSSDDNSNLIATENLAGTWNLQSFENKINTTINFLGVPVASNTDAIGEDIQMQITFSENPNIVVSQGSYTLVVTTTILTKTETQEFATNDAVLAGSWSLSGKEVTITNNDPDVDEEFRNITYKIIELSQSRLQLIANFTTTQIIEGNEADLKIRSELVMTKP